MVLGLSKKRIIECDDYIFPAEYFDIPGIKGFDDFDSVDRYCNEKMNGISDDDITILVNAGLTLELLAAVKSGTLAGKKISVGIYNKSSGVFEIINSCNALIKDSAEYCSKESMLLCNGRHVVDCGKYIYDVISDEDLYRFEFLEEQAYSKLYAYRGECISVYVTGLSQLVICTLKAAARLDINIVWLHYNHDTEEYVKQVM